ncbi:MULTISPECIES: superoxide dismutase family protein [Bacillus]|uniref:superoxide dismutase family protein n=1 Tax=Bacillus TaxID=1386 RepID=UPI0002D77A30|nr:MULTISPECIES: superoxide dismutase family protein [Bacillus]
MKLWYIVASLFILSGCVEKNSTKMNVVMYDASGDNLGEIALTQLSSGIELDIDLEGLPPGDHAIHFHEKGSCKAPDFKSAGNHFNPDENNHGLMTSKGPHVGDLPNIHVDEKGVVKVKLTSDASLKEGKNMLLTPEGTSIVIHEKIDDGMTQPAGNSGARLACGVIKKK